MSNRDSTDAYRPERTPPGSPLYTYGVSSTAQDSFNCWCSCGWIETGWPQERIAAASLSAHLGSNHGRARTAA
jgi:hypothetical protein